MPIPVRITFRDMESSNAVRADAERHAERLGRLSDRITDCHVIVAEPHRHGHRGRLFRVEINLTLPGGQIQVSRGHDDKHAHEDVHVALRDAFLAAERQLARQLDTRATDRTPAEPPPHGHIARLLPDYGFIDAGVAGEIYFHRNALAEGRFEDLAVGDEVRFALAPDDSEHGPQASTVHRLGKRHIPEPDAL